MSSLPYFRFFVVDYLGGPIRCADMETQGVFINICANYWDRGCSLNKDSIILKQCLSNAKANVLAMLQQLHCLTVDDNGEISIDFLDEQWSELYNSHVRRVKAGRKGGKSNAKAKPKQCLSNAKARAYDSDSDSDSPIDDGFNAFWDAYGKKTDRKKTEKAWKNLSQTDRDEIMLAVPEYVASTPDPKFRKNPLTYLNGRNWEDEIIIRTTTGNQTTRQSIQEFPDDSVYEGQQTITEDENGNPVF